ncbi:hypothetical protein PGTUg99_006790 [Puccinia graminis f. sp. tritici]|uniref:Uncharacterized protein n=1 Tax=Puccinia graminis f. sp. tritici TaxID=56615 RepID=A0A5B0P9Z4_PUCGR|nr:hypothetical protein PGTUg99_006790 [Puccinia graminis f. sp. tritici]
MTNMCYLFNSNEVVNYLQESVKAIKTMVSKMEPDQLPVDYEKNHYQMKLSHARHIEDFQARILGWALAEKTGELKLNVGKPPTKGLFTLEVLV